MHLLPRYASSLESQRLLLIEIYEAFIDECLKGAWPPYIWHGQLPDGREIRVEPYGSLFRAVVIIGGQKWRYQTHVQALSAALSYRGYASDPPGDCEQI